MRSRDLSCGVAWCAVTSLLGCNPARMFSDRTSDEGGSGGDGGDGGTSSAQMSDGGTSPSASGASSNAAGASGAGAAATGGGATQTGTGGTGQASGGADTGGAPTNGGAGGGDPEVGGNAGGGSIPGGGAGSDGGSGGGANPGGAGAGGAGAGGAEPGVEGIIGVGYGGLRVVSRDGGENWESETHWTVNGEDDEYLLRVVAYGNGLWMAGGGRIATSPDGVTWEDRGISMDAVESTYCLIIDAMAFGNGQFLVVCGSRIASTTDGIEWEDVGETPAIDGVPHLAFNPDTNLFGISGDGSASFVSEDGEDWEEIQVDRLRYCLDAFRPAIECPAFWHAGAFLAPEWDGYIRRSTDGEEWTNVYTDEFENNIFMDYSFAAGRVRATP